MESPFTDRLNTNYYATDAEIPKIRQIISESLEERSRINNRITQFQILIDDLCVQMKKVDDHIRAHRTLIAGIRTLPVELLQTIFRWCLPPRNPAMSVMEAPLLLGRVCSMWRKICYSTPQLWSSLHLHAPSRAAQQADEHELLGEAAIAWLNRSSTLPLTISFVDDEPEHFPTGQESIVNSHLPEILLRFSHRWNHLNLRVNHLRLSNFARLTEHDIPLLKTVQLEVMHPPSWNDNKLSPLPFLCSPSIKKIFLWNYISSPPASALPLRWEILNELSIVSRSYQATNFLTMNEILLILSRCSSLVTCALDITAASEVLTAPLQPLSLPCLQELRVDLNVHLPEDHIASLFRILDTPKLRHMELMRAHMFRVIPFMPLLHRQHRIDTISFDVEQSAISDLVDCLYAAPFLRRLCLNSSPSVPWVWSMEIPNWSQFPRSLCATFLTHLSPTSSATASILCPLLEEVEIRFPSPSDVTDDDLLRFILSRTTLAPEGVAHLTRATFTFQRDRQRDIQGDLEDAIRGGLRFCIRHRNPPPTPSSEPTFLPFKDIDISKAHYDWIPRDLSPSWNSPSWGFQS